MHFIDVKNVIRGFVEFKGIDVGVVQGMGDNVSFEQLGSELGVESEDLVLIGLPFFPSTVSPLPFYLNLRLKKICADRIRSVLHVM